MRVIIHSCDKRLWYVNKILVPTLREQGIEPEIHNDDEHRSDFYAACRRGRATADEHQAEH